MFELNNKPMVWYIIQTLKNINIKKPIMVVGYKNELIKKYFYIRRKILNLQRSWKKFIDLKKEAI